ncbi:MAG: hypothetical protein ACK5BQ_00230 [Ignavibacteria bacterium]|jgi:hypothetical protein
MAQRTVDTDVFDAEVLAELIVAMAEVEQFKKGKLDLPVLSVKPGVPFDEETKAQIAALFEQSKQMKR